MVSLIKKVISGRRYYYAVESRRVEGKPRIVWQKYLGTAEKIVSLVEGAEKRVKLKSFSFGKNAALLSVAEELGFVEIVNEVVSKKKVEGLTVGEYLLLIILGRCNGPLSKHRTAEWFKDSFLSFTMKFSHKLNSQNLLNNMEYLDEIAIRTIEEKRSSP